MSTTFAKTNVSSFSSGSGALRSQTNAPDEDPSKVSTIRISLDRSRALFAPSDPSGVRIEFTEGYDSY